MGKLSTPVRREHELAEEIVQETGVWECVSPNDRED
jgi:hypothetical protein